MRRRFAVSVVLPVLAACAHGTSGAAVPYHAHGCDFDLSGAWQEENDSGLRYQASDDGTHLSLLPHRVNPDGTPAAADSGPGDIQMDLERGPYQFAGELRMKEAAEPGRDCPLLLQVKVLSCATDRLALEIQQTYALNPSCATVDLGSIASDQHVLVRIAAAPR